jgi:hypothetical protein
MIYRQMASARRDDELDRVLAEVRDRYGPLPPSVMNLADFGRIRIMADRLGVETLDREGQTVVFRFRQQARLDPERLVALVRRRGDLTLMPPAGLRLDMRPAGQRAASRPSLQDRPREASPPGWPSQAQRPPSSSKSPSGRPLSTPSPAPASWWTARATAGEVTAGFTKAEILKPAADDPRGENGVFMKVGGLLSELLG